jgi:LuxR family transcriptional regulator, maltose regulon positive regulatory protein
MGAGNRRASIIDRRSARGGYSDAMTGVATSTLLERRSQVGDPEPPDRSQWGWPAVARARITMPPPPSGAVERARLFDMLDAGVQRRLTVVTGPPGAGKTLLVSTWAAHPARPHPPGRIAWLSIERRDSRPAHFWSAVIAAARAAGVPGLESFTSHIPLDHEEFTAAFANALSALRAPLVLILDDYHELSSAVVHEQLDALLRYAPDKLRVVIVGRADPPVALHRLRLEGHLAEVRTADLAFTLSEATALFGLAGLELTPDLVAALHERTEGWVAGLRLAALSLEGHDDPESLVSTFAGDEGTIADYLVEEVLHHQPQPIREFMLRTSVVDVISPELADALTGHSDGARVLDQLERSGAFVSRIAESGGWYRYHGLFGELLRSQLRHSMPDTFARQHRRAARWYAQHGLNVPATRHALAARDWDLAANLLATSWLGLLVRGESATVAELIGELPRSLVAREPELATAAGGALLEAGELEQGQDYLRLADDQASTVRSGRRTEFVLARTMAQLYEARATGDLESVVATARKLLAGQGSMALSLDGRERRALALLNLGIAETWTGDRRHARSALEESIALARHADRDYLVFSALGPLALVEALTGSLRRPARLAHEAVDLAERHGWTSLPPMAATYCALAICAYHWNSVPDATRYLDWAHSTGRAAGEPPVLMLVELMRALLALRLGDHERAQAAIVSARELAGNRELPPRLALVLACAEGVAMIAAGRPERAAQVISKSAHDGRWAEVELVKARLALAGGDPKGAVALLSDAQSGTLGVLHPATAIELRALAAVAQHQRGDDDAALGLVEEALELAEPEGYQGPFLTIGAPLRELISRRIRAGTAHRALAGQLGEALGPHAGRAYEQRGALVLDPLSERETAVLRFLPTPLSKAEIASEMFVSVNTVKTHMKNIYRKLDVTDRAQAVRRARTLHLV